MNMLVNPLYQPVSIVRFEQSLLSLGAALDEAAADSSKEDSASALLEVELLNRHLQGKV